VAAVETSLVMVEAQEKYPGDGHLHKTLALSARVEVVEAEATLATVTLLLEVFIPLQVMLQIIMESLVALVLAMVMLQMDNLAATVVVAVVEVVALLLKAAMAVTAFLADAEVQVKQPQGLQLAVTAEVV
jgi:hypothetical protein